MRKTDVEVLVPLEDLYRPELPGAAEMSMLPRDTEDYLKRTYGVTAHRDHRFRLAVTIEDAYKIRDARQSEAERLHAEHLTRAREAGDLLDWQRARNRFWEWNWLRTLRATPIPASGNQVEQINLARVRMSELILAGEAAAGIPDSIQRRLVWPAYTFPYRYPENSDRPEAYDYVAPKLEEE